MFLMVTSVTPAGSANSICDILSSSFVIIFADKVPMQQIP
jgi:hypothetical protein